MTLFPGRPAQVGPAHDAQSPILAYLPHFSPHQIALFAPLSSRLRIQGGYVAAALSRAVRDRAGTLASPGSRIQSGFAVGSLRSNRGVISFLRAAHNLIQHPAIFRPKPSSIEQLRPVAPSLLQRTPPPPLPYLLVVSAQQHFRHIPPAERRRPRVMRIIKNAVIRDL